MTFRTFLYWIPAIIMAATGKLQAQEDRCNLTVAGRVVDQHNEEPLTFAEVYIPDSGKGAVVDSNGYYRISNLCPGEYTIVASHIGCEPVVKIINLTKSTAAFNFYLEHHPEVLTEVKVTETKLRETAEPGITLTESEIEAARGKSVAEAIEGVSGVSTLKTGSSIIKPVIHGLYGNRVVTLNNGVRQEDQQWGLEHGLNIDLFSIDEVTVVKGVSAVQYGAGALGGVVKLQPSPLPRNKTVQGNFYLIGESNGLGGAVSARITQGWDNGWAYRLQISGKKRGDLSAPDYILSNTGAEGLNGSLNLGYNISKLYLNLYYSRFSYETGILRASHNSSISDIDSAIARGRPWFIKPFTYEIDDPRQVLIHDLAKISAEHRLSSQNSFTVNYALQHDQRKEFDIRRRQYAHLPSNHLRLITQTLDLELSNQKNEDWYSRYGITGMLQVNSNVPGANTRPILPNYNLYQTGLYAIERYRVNDWVLEAGLRYDYQNIIVQKFGVNNNLIISGINFHNLAASAGITHTFSPHWQLSSMLAYAYRPPHIIELFSEGLHHGAASIELGDSELIPERSLNWSSTLSANYSATKVEVTTYLNPFRDYIYLQPQPEIELTVRGAFPVYRYTQNDALLAGLDLSLTTSLSEKWKYRLNGSYTRGYNLSEGADLVLIPPPQAIHSLRYVIGNFSIFRNCYTELSQKLAGRQTHYPKGLELSPPPPGYQLLSWSAGTDLIAGNSGRKLSAVLIVENILNTPYRDYLNRFRYYADSPGRNFLIKIKYQF